MLLFQKKLLSMVLQEERAYSRSEDQRLLGSAQGLAFQFVAERAEGVAPTLSVALEHSADGEHWATAAVLVDAVSLSTTTVTSLRASYSVAPTLLPLVRVMLLVEGGGALLSAYASGYGPIVGTDSPGKSPLFVREIYDSMPVNGDTSSVEYAELLGTVSSALLVNVVASRMVEGSLLSVWTETSLDGQHWRTAGTLLTNQSISGATVNNLVGADTNVSNYGRFVRVAYQLDTVSAAGRIRMIAVGR